VEAGKIFDEGEKNFGGVRRPRELVEGKTVPTVAGRYRGHEVEGGRTLDLPDGLSDLRLQCSRT
jgi:hypothetical protein